jgi:hypothetical protein
VAHVGRCGSTVLGDLIGQHPMIHYDGETYRHGMGKQLLDSGEIAWTPSTRGLEVQLARAVRSSSAAWFGFDFLPLHLRVAGMSVSQHAGVLRRLGFTHLVILRRKNLLRRVVSMRRARASGAWTSRSEQAPLSVAPAPVDVAVGSPGGGLVAEFERLERFYVDVEQSHGSGPVLHLTYEDDIEHDPTVAYRRVVDFVGAPQHSPALRLEKQSSGDLRTAIRNFDEVALQLVGTRYEWMLEDGR